MLSRIYIHALMIISIIMVGISPACAFISGHGSNGGMIEICAPDGTIQVIEVDAAFDPMAQPMQLAEHLEAMEQCSYCFAMDHQKYGEAQTHVIVMNALPRYLSVSSGTAIPLGSDLTLYQSRGPPQLS